jgi:hypothetical protein
MDPALIIGGVIALAGIAAGAAPYVGGYLERKRRDEAEEAERRRDHELRQAILRNDLVRDATAGQETAQYAQRIRAIAAGEEAPKTS